jgi:5-methylcytosine-specific restriction endonuclease McrA
VLREEKNGSWRSERALFLRVHRFEVAGAGGADRALRPSRLDRIAREQLESPQALMRRERRVWWWHRDRYWWEDDELTAADVQALVAERERRKERQLERAHSTLQAEASARSRPSIPREVRLAVWRREGGRCAACGATELLQFDHVIPLALGGSSSAANLELLCDDCNRAKGASLG